MLSVSAEAGIGVAGALSAHWSLVADLGGALAYPVSSGGDAEALWALRALLLREACVSFGTRRASCAVTPMTDRLLPFRRPSASRQLPDDALLSAVATGDNAALEELFQRHGDAVHRILSRLRTIDRRDLDDVVQTTFLEVQRSAARYDGRATVGTWIIGIAMNVARHHTRGEVRRRAAVSAIAEMPVDRGRRRARTTRRRTGNCSRGWPRRSTSCPTISGSSSRSATSKGCAAWTSPASSRSPKGPCGAGCTTPRARLRDRIDREGQHEHAEDDETVEDDGRLAWFAASGSVTVRRPGS